MNTDPAMQKVFGLQKNLNTDVFIFNFTNIIQQDKTLKIINRAS